MEILIAIGISFNIGLVIWFVAMSKYTDTMKKEKSRKYLVWMGIGIVIAIIPAVLLLPRETNTQRIAIFSMAMLLTYAMATPQRFVKAK